MGAVVSHNPPTREGQGGSGEGVIESARTRGHKGTDSSFFECSCRTYPVSFSWGGERVYRQDSCG